MKIEKTVFGTMEDGTKIYLYSMENGKGMKAQVINYGAIMYLIKMGMWKMWY